MKRRLGFDPYELSRMDKRTRYLIRVCGDLPPIGSQEREALRKGISLAEAVRRIQPPQEGEDDMVI